MHSLRRLTGILVVAVPLRKVHHAPTHADVALNKPRHRRDVLVPRPARLDASAVEACRYREHSVRRPVLLWVSQNDWTGVVPAVGHELQDTEQSEPSEPNAFADA